jgi:hypothetical protein
MEVQTHQPMVTDTIKIISNFLLANVAPNPYALKPAAGFGAPMAISKTGSWRNQLSLFQPDISKRHISCDFMFIGVRQCTDVSSKNAYHTIKEACINMHFLTKRRYNRPTQM